MAQGLRVRRPQLRARAAGALAAAALAIGATAGAGGHGLTRGCCALRAQQPPAPPAPPTPAQPTPAQPTPAQPTPAPPTPAPPTPAPPTPAEAATAELPPEELVARLLERHHGPLRNTFDTAVLRLREQRDAPNESAVQITYSLPERLRVDHPQRRVDLWIEGTGWRCQPGSPAQRLAAGEGLDELERLRQHARALTLLPLYRAEEVSRAGPGVLALILPGGETWRLEVDEPSLRIVELRGPAGPVRFASFLHTGITVLPAEVALEGVGRRFVEIVASGLYLDGSVFEDPYVRVDVERARQQPTARRELRVARDLPTRAELQDIERRSFLVLDDPGDWQGRSQQILAAGEALGAKGQAPAGLPTYAAHEGELALWIPFRPDPAQGSQPYVRAPGERIRHEPAHRAVVVAPPPAAWDDACQAARRLIDAFLERERLAPRGEPRITPFLEPGQVPDAETLQRLQIRVEQPIEG